MITICFKHEGQRYEVSWWFGSRKVVLPSDVQFDLVVYGDELYWLYEKFEDLPKVSGRVMRFYGEVADRIVAEIAMFHD